MGFIDSLVGWLSPKAGCERLAWRQHFDELRGYDAGNRERINTNWHAHNDSAENVDRYNRDTIRARARDLERNSDIAQSVTRAYRRNVIGKGFTLQAKTGDENVNALLEQAWRRWCKARNCDVTGTQSLTQILRMLETRKRVDGGMLLVKCYTGQGFIPFQLQCIEVDELDVSQVKPHDTGNYVVGGIEYNSFRRPVGYYIKQYSLDGWQEIDPRYVPAKDVIFYYSKQRPSQIREISDLSPTLTRIRDANEFITAVSVKERIAACFGILIKRITGGMANPQALMSGRNSRGDGRSVDYDEKRITPGMILEMNAGDEAQIVDPKSTGADSTTFLKTLNGMIGAGQGLSYEVTSRDMSQTNYSSARQGLIEDEMTFAEDVEAIMDILDDIYETFVISCVLSGYISLPDFWTDKAKYFDHYFSATPRKWIDPQKEANATATALRTGQKTYKQIAAESGKDWREQIDDIAEVLEYATARGVNLSSVLFGAELTAPEKESDGDDNADEEAGDE